MTMTSSRSTGRTAGPGLASLLALASGVRSLRAASGRLLGAASVCRSMTYPPHFSKGPTGGPAARFRFRGLLASIFAFSAAFIFPTSAEAYLSKVKIELQNDGSIDVSAQHNCGTGRWRVYMKKASESQFKSAHVVHFEELGIRPERALLSHKIEDLPDENNVDIKISINTAFNNNECAGALIWLDSDTKTITLTMHFAEPTIADQRYRVNTAIAALELPEATPKATAAGR